MRWPRRSLSTLAVSAVVLAGGAMVAASVHGVTQLDGDLAAAAHQQQRRPALERDVRWEHRGPSSARDCPSHQRDRRPWVRPASLRT